MDHSQSEGLTASQNQIGRVFIHNFGGLDVYVRVLDVRYSYGRRQLKVEPVGQSEEWNGIPEAIQEKRRRVWVCG